MLNVYHDENDDTKICRYKHSYELRQLSLASIRSVVRNTTGRFVMQNCYNKTVI